MKITQRHFRLTAVAAALTAMFGGALADDEVDELIEPESTISVGVGNWSGDRKQTGVYDGMQEGKTYGLIDAEIVKRDNETGTWYKLQASGLGLDNREISAEYLRQGNLGIKLDYDRISRDDPKTILTRLQGGGTTVQTTNAGASYDPKLGTVREQTGLSIYKSLLPGLDFNLSFKNEEKTGQRQWSKGSAIDFTIEPIDANTRQLEASLSYATKEFQIQGGYYGSWYDNQYKQIIVDGSNYMSVPLDNQAHQLFLNGGYNFTKSTRATFKLEYSRASQNDSLLPTPGNAANATLPGAPDKLDAKVVTTLAQFGLTSRPIKDLTLNANLRYHDMKDKTPVATFSTNGTSPDYTAFSYRTLTGKLEGTYRLDENYSLSAGLEDKRQDRGMPVRVSGATKQFVVPMRKEVDELTSRVELRRSLSDTLNGSIAYLNARRTGKGDMWANVSAGGGLTDYRNSINPLHIADRKRDKLRLAIDWAPIDALSLQLNAEESRDRYENSAARPFGLNKGTARLYGVDAAYTVSEKLKLSAWYSYDQSKADQLAYRNDSSTTKDYDLEETGHSFGLGLRAEATSRLNLGADLEWFNSRSKYRQTLTNPPAPPLANFTYGVPDIQNTHLRLGLFSLYALDRHADLRLDFIHERWKTDDWSWTFANGQPFSYNGTTFIIEPKSSTSFIGARYIYKFQ